MSEVGQITCDCETETACCAALEAEPIDQPAAEDVALGFKALGDPYRVAIIHLLSAATGPVCLVDIERHLPLAQSTVSYHLKTLVDAGVLDRERSGRWSYYTVLPERLDMLKSSLAQYSNLISTPSS